MYHEYRCYKGFPRVVLFAVCDVARRFLFADVGLPGVLGDATIYERSRLQAMIDMGEWLGTEIPPLDGGVCGSPTVSYG